MRARSPARHLAFATVSVAAVMTGAIAPRPAVAEEAGGIAYDVRTDAAVTVAAAGLMIASEVLVKRTATLGAAWTGTNGLDSSVGNALVWRDTRAASLLSTTVAVVAAPAVTLGLTALASAHDGPPPELAIDALLIAEATAVDGVVNQVVKFTARRQRPCAASSSCPDSNSRPSKDDNLSFYSQHTSLIFAMAASAGTIARLRGHRWAPLVWLGVAALGATTAYLRIAAGEHYFTDVLAGAVVGTSIGAGVPYLLHRPDAAHAQNTARAEREQYGSLAVIPSANGGTVTYALRF